MSTSRTGDCRKGPISKPVLWTPGDWNAFFSDSAPISWSNMLVLTGPAEIRAEDAGLAGCSAASCRRSA